MTGQLDVSREDNLGIIALNRPEAINALSSEMIDGITRTLEQWRDDDGIRLVMFEGRGPRGFCAGGDVRHVRQLVLDGQAEAADAYFAAEYRMNAVIAGYPKPTVALAHGVVMGGGIGIAGHCRFRFASADARFAMPEAAIGFACDVGVHFTLARTPLPRALAFALTGLPVSAADGMALGLTDCAIDPSRYDAVRAAIAATGTAASVETALTQLMQAELVSTGEAAFTEAIDQLGGYDWTDLETIFALSEREPLLAILRRRSPTSLAAIHLGQLAARGMAGIADVLAMDLRLAGHLARQPDFVEGVRAVLVDKDNTAAWLPAELRAVDISGIRDVIAGA